MANRAPGSLGLVQAFVNTLDVEEAREELDSPEALRRWLDESGLLSSGEVTAANYGRALELREALRRLLLANNGGVRLTADLELLDRIARESGLLPRFTVEGGFRLEPAADGGRGALGRLLALVSEAMREGTWSRLKACDEGSCQWAFFDQSRNRSGRWCSMEVCGNRAKARQFRRRRGARAGA
jgi:predicted RNA-binding Zn ribbon-like protein